MLRLLLGCLIAGGSGFLFLLSVTFGSGGFGGSLPHEHEGLSQALLAIAMLAPASLVWITGSIGWAVLVLQVALVLMGVRLGD